MNTKNNVSNERTKNKTAAFAIVTVALALAMMTAASIIGTQGPQQVNAQNNNGALTQSCTQESDASSSSGGFGTVCVQEAGQCEVAQNSGRDSAGEINGDTQDCS